MDEYDDPVSREDDIRRPGQVVTMQPKPKPHTVQDAADTKFRPCVLSSDPPHVFGSLGFG